MLFKRTNPELHVGDVIANYADVRTDSAKVLNNKAINIIGHIQTS